MCSHLKRIQEIQCVIKLSGLDPGKNPNMISLRIDSQGVGHRKYNGRTFTI